MKRLLISFHKGRSRRQRKEVLKQFFLCTERFWTALIICVRILQCHLSQSGKRLFHRSPALLVPTCPVALCFVAFYLQSLHTLRICVLSVEWCSCVWGHRVSFVFWMQHWKGTWTRRKYFGVRAENDQRSDVWMQSEVSDNFCPAGKWVSEQNNRSCSNIERWIEYRKTSCSFLKLTAL